jgi:hypothetical protein
MRPPLPQFVGSHPMDPNATYADQCIAQLQTIMLIFRDDVNDVDHKINDLTQKFEAFQQGCSAAIQRLSDSLHIREQQATGMTMRIHALEQSPVEPLLQRLQQLEGMVQQLKAIQEGSGQNIGQALTAAFEKITNTENVAERQQQLSSAIVDALRGHPSQADLQSLQGASSNDLNRPARPSTTPCKPSLQQWAPREKATPPPSVPLTAPEDLKKLQKDAKKVRKEMVEAMVQVRKQCAADARRIIAQSVPSVTPTPTPPPPLQTYIRPPSHMESHYPHGIPPPHGAAAEDAYGQHPQGRDTTEPTIGGFHAYGRQPSVSHHNSDYELMISDMMARMGGAPPSQSRMTSLGRTAGVGQSSCRPPESLREPHKGGEAPRPRRSPFPMWRRPERLRIPTSIRSPALHGDGHGSASRATSGPASCPRSSPHPAHRHTPRGRRTCSPSGARRIPHVPDDDGSEHDPSHAPVHVHGRTP